MKEHTLERRLITGSKWADNNVVTNYSVIRSLSKMKSRDEHCAGKQIQWLAYCLKCSLISSSKVMRHPTACSCLLFWKHNDWQYFTLQEQTLRQLVLVFSHQNPSLGWGKRLNKVDRHVVSLSSKLGNKIACSGSHFTPLPCVSCKHIRLLDARFFSLILILDANAEPRSNWVLSWWP